MLTEEQAAADYADATDGCRHSLVGTRDNARQWQRVKPDPETNPLAELDWEKKQRGISPCHWLLLHERVRAVDSDHAFRLQLRCGIVNIRLIHPRELS
jgi:hypothetical protein